MTRIWSESALFVVVAVSLVGLAWADPAHTPGRSPTVALAPDRPVPGGADDQVVATRASVAVVAGRLDAAKRARVKDVVVQIVDRYLDGAFVAGPYPRDDFAAAFADFRRGAAVTAEADLDLLTNHDIGARVSAVTATRRRLRIDVLAPGGRPGAVTARFVLEFEATGIEPVAQKVVGSLFLTNQQGAWRVFGYTVRKQVAS